MEAHRCLRHIDAAAWFRLFIDEDSGAYYKYNSLNIFKLGEDVVMECDFTTNVEDNKNTFYRAKCVEKAKFKIEVE